MRGVRHEVLADLVELVFGCHVTDHDSGVGVAVRGVGELGGVDDPRVVAAGLEIAERRGLLGEDDAGAHRLARFQAAQQGLGEAGVEECFANRSTGEGAPAEKFLRGGVGEKDVRPRVHDKECVPKGIEQAVAFIFGLFEIEFESQFPCLYPRFVFLP